MKLIREFVNKNKSYSAATVQAVIVDKQINTRISLKIFRASRGLFSFPRTDRSFVCTNLNKNKIRPVENLPSTESSKCNLQIFFFSQKEIFLSSK